ncbi:hypothetical protein AXI59_01470 [Bacillus nakamurai]|uniref:hypothetical protein n=1 Tax=Bacillus nakamurai TaxID=1793963 RepID=UPI0007782364|nr:hypothetical protein [Bacillus nakamurai]KXZ16586.1 hypothetical protein AXI59_01470 [Bacillus nakamurai]MCP6681946.1 hypothetical protein [Bacillus nakamurai]
MKLETANLLKALSEYQFYHWEDHEENQHHLMIGLPEDMINIRNFYDSFGFECIDNEYSDVKISKKQWTDIENLFFQWVSPYLSTFNQTIVTPFLSNDWEGEFDLEDIDEDELAAAYKKYKEFLISKDLYDKTPTLIETSRGYKINNADDFSTLGKMAARNNKYLFFADEEKVFMFTDSLTFNIYFKNQEVLEKEKEKIVQLLSPQFLI